MVMNLDKCIGCHTCSVTCKNVWTNRDGAEYMWFNDVETKPGVGYPKRWEDQDTWQRRLGARHARARLELKSGSRSRRLFNIFFNPDLPSLDDYYEPFTYDYDALTTRRPERAPARRAARSRPSPASRWRSSGGPTGRTTSPGRPSTRPPTPTCAASRTPCGWSTSASS